MKSWSAFALGALLCGASAATARSDKRPSIVFIFSDDHDAKTESIKTMPHAQKLLVQEGLSFKHFFAPISVCCPSRTSFFRAQAAHNTNLTHLWAPYGGYEVFLREGFNGHYLPTYLQEAGYDTRYVGKFLNEHKIANYAIAPPLNWTEAEFLLDPNTYDYWNATFTVPGSDDLEVRLGEYSTDVIAEKALKQLDKAAKEDKPFFLGIAPIGPHGHFPVSVLSQPLPTDGTPLPDFPSELKGHSPRSAPRHQHLFNDVFLNKSRESFNPDRPSGVSWVARLPKLNSTHIDYIEHYYRQRLRALQAVDELIESVVKKLEEMGELENTYIIYSADNGYETSAGHRRHPGKMAPYEEDITVPLVIRGPNVPRGVVDTNSAYSLVDLGATILSLAGAATDYENDGAVIPVTKKARANSAPKGISLAEFWVEAINEGQFGSHTFVNNTYRNVRVIEDDINFSYAVWCSGDYEIYDINADPDQMDNLAEPAWDGRPRPAYLAQYRTRLNALLLALKECIGDTCRNPWPRIFPNGEVKSFKAALHEKYDQYFATIPTVKYSTCAIGYHRVLEAPFWDEKLAYRSSAKFVLQAGSA